MKMVKGQNNVMWKKINVSNPVFASEGLIAIEECTNYNLLNDTLRSSHLQNVKRKIKQSNINYEPNKKKQKPSVIHKDNSVIVPSKCGSSTSDSLETNVMLEMLDNTDNFTAWANFGLPPEIIKALCAQNFQEPTQIQSLTLPASILGRRDIIGAAETGSGKTLAFGLPVLTGIINEKNKCSQSNKTETSQKPLYALILTPTRELAVQIKNHLEAVATFLDINIAVLVGGMASVKQERILNKGPEIVVATPGRLWELIQQGNPHLSQINDIKFLVIDETDRMLEKGHFEELHDLLERINLDETKKKIRQNFVFSATLTLVHDLPKYLIRKMRKSKLHKMNSEQKLQKIIDILGITNPKIVDLTHGDGTSKTLTESRVTCAIDEKDYYVYYFLQKHPGRTLIFCNSIGCVRRLTNLLSILGYDPLPLHASMQQKQRLKNLEKFRDDEEGILIATDVAARGLDVPKIKHVLHYQTPRTSESYVHRSGRTARALRQGITVLLIEPTEVQNYIKLCKTLKKSEDLPIFPVEENYLNAVKERVNLAREIDRLELFIRKNNSEQGWFRKAAEEMDIIIDDFAQCHDKSEVSSQKKLASFKRKQLTSLLAKPIFPRGFSGKYFLSSKEYSSASTNKNTETAVEIVKESVKEKKKHIPLFKPNKKFQSLAN